MQEESSRPSSKQWARLSKCSLPVCKTDPKGVWWDKFTNTSPVSNVATSNGLPESPYQKKKTSQFPTNHEEKDYQPIVDKSDQISQRNFHLLSTLWITNLTHAKSHIYMGHHVFLSAEYSQYSKVWHAPITTYWSLPLDDDSSRWLDASYPICELEITIRGARNRGKALKRKISVSYWKLTPHLGHLSQSIVACLCYCSIPWGDRTALSQRASRKT